MNTRPRRVPTRFAPVTRFEVEPRLLQPAGLRHSAEFEGLKEQLLARHLADAGDARLAPALRRAALEAAALAWATGYPLLVFPELLAEKTELARQHTVKQAVILRRSLALSQEAA
jgi:hypothetical protein